MADQLRRYLDGKPAGVPIWGGAWARDRRGAEMLCIDLKAVGVPYVVEGLDGPEYMDFRGWRHCDATAVSQLGDLRAAQLLCGHARPEQTAIHAQRVGGTVTDGEQTARRVTGARVLNPGANLGVRFVLGWLRVAQFGRTGSE